MRNRTPYSPVSDLFLFFFLAAAQRSTAVSRFGKFDFDTNSYNMLVA